MANVPRWVMANSGNDTTATGTYADPYATIDYAESQANTDDIIIAVPEFDVSDNPIPFVGELSATKSMHYIFLGITWDAGAPSVATAFATAGNTTWEGSCYIYNTGTSGTFFNVGHTSTYSGLTIDGSGSNDRLFRSGVANTVVENCVLTGSVATSGAFVRALGATIYRNLTIHADVKGTSRAFSFEADSFSVFDTTISNCFDAFQGGTSAITHAKRINVYNVTNLTVGTPTFTNQTDADDFDTWSTDEYGMDPGFQDIDRSNLSIENAIFRPGGTRSGKFGADNTTTNPDYEAVRGASLMVFNPSDVMLLHEDPVELTTGWTLGGSNAPTTFDNRDTATAPIAAGLEASGTSGTGTAEQINFATGARTIGQIGGIFAELKTDGPSSNDVINFSATSPDATVEISPDGGGYEEHRFNGNIGATTVTDMDIRITFNKSAVDA